MSIFTTNQALKLINQYDLHNCLFDLRANLESAGIENDIMVSTDEESDDLDISGFEGLADYLPTDLLMQAEDLGLSINLY